MAEQLLMCRCCRTRDIDKSKPDTYVVHGRGWYYHKTCWEDFIRKKDDVLAVAKEDEWKDLLWDYLKRDIKLPNLNFAKIDQQWHNFLYKSKGHMTAKGLFFTCRYYYEIQHGDPNKAEGGIGILPYYYIESCAYWTARANVNQRLQEQIQKQIIDYESTPEKTVIAAPTTRRKKKSNLADIMEEDE